MSYAWNRKVTSAGAWIHLALTLAMGCGEGWRPSSTMSYGACRGLDAESHFLLPSERLHRTKVVLLLLTWATDACLIHGKTGLRIGSLDRDEEGRVMSGTEMVEVGIWGGTRMVVFYVVGVRIYMQAAASVVHILLLLERQDGEVNGAVRRGQGTWDRGNRGCNWRRDGVAASTGKLHGHISVHSPLPLAGIWIVMVVGSC